MLLELNIKTRRGQLDLNSQLTIQQNYLGVFGKSGAGKSTLLGLIAGSLQPESGSIILDGKILYDSKKGIMVPREQRSVSAVLQQDLPNCTESVQSILKSTYQRTLKQRRLFSLPFLIELLELKTLLDTPLNSLSAGERQRTLLARALLKTPRLLLLDEAFAPISQDHRLQILPLLNRLQNELKIPIIYASQCLGEILEFTDQLVILEQGKMLNKGSLREFAKEQGLLHYLGMRQIDNILNVQIVTHDRHGGSTHAHASGIAMNLPFRPRFSLGSETQIAIRASDVALSKSFIEGISIQNQLKGRICALIPSGASIIVQVDCGLTLLAEITPGACRSMALRENDQVFCLIKTHAIQYLTEADARPAQRIISHGTGEYYLQTDTTTRHNNATWP